jgi:hypothetical protein
MDTYNDKELKLPIELETEFQGKGQMSNFHFRQIEKTQFGYIYELTTEFGKPHYEVFERREQKEMDTEIQGQKVHYDFKIVYPSNNAFGDWAFACKQLEKAKEYLSLFEKIINIREINKILKQ